MAFDLITLSVADNIATITLNNPERLNAMAPHMADEISNALDELGDARVVLITGAGRAFCSGADLSGRGGGGLGGQAAYAALTRSYNPLMQKIARLDVPMVAAVNGAAAGIGCSLALACDFVIAGTNGYFLQAFVNIGLVPDGGASWMLPRLIGKARATEMMMLGERIYGEQAADWGLIYKCVADDVLIDEARALATRLANGPTLALGMMRQTIAAGLEVGYGHTLMREAETQRDAGNSADAVEGAMSFLQKRKAEFKGQ